MGKTIIIKIDNKGELLMDFENFKGGECLDKLNAIADKLQAEITKKDEKLELYEQSINTHNHIEIDKL